MEDLENLKYNLEKSLEEKKYTVVSLLSKLFLKSEIVPHDPNGVPIYVKIICNWIPSEKILQLWNKMTQGAGRWNNIQFSSKKEADYYVIINSPYIGEFYEKEKTILFRMEPNMKNHPELWREWADPDDKMFLKVLRHEKGDFNNNEWHLSKTYLELQKDIIKKDPLLEGIISTVLSDKYFDPGHIKRVDFVKFLESKNVPIHVFGTNRWDYKDFKGSLPPYEKDKGILPYKYTFNVENCFIPNYFTEKIIDAILGECLIFYSGCFNLKEYLDEKAFVYLELSNFEQDFLLIQKAIKENWYEQRLPYIKEAKRKILNEYQFCPRVEKIIKEKEANNKVPQ